MATLTSLGTTSINGLKLGALAAATPAGDDFVNDGRCMLIVTNANVGATRTVTIHSVQTCDTGALEHDQDVVVPASSTAYIYGFVPKRWNASSTQKVSITYSDAGADITVGYVVIG